MRVRALLIIVALALAGCGEAQTTPQPQAAQAPAPSAAVQPTAAEPTATPRVTATAAPAEPTAAGATAAIDTTSLALPDGAVDMKVEDGSWGKEVTYLVDMDLAEVIAFYNQELAPLGVQIDCGLSSPESSFYSCSTMKNGIGVFLNLDRRSATETHVNIELADLDGPAQDSEPAQPAGGAGNVEIKDGLPVPADASRTSDQSGPFRRALSISSEMEVASLVEFYRAELPALGWTELADLASVEDSAAVLMFENDEGPLAVELTASGGGTEILLTTKALAAATAAGILPASGQARVILGNMGDADATVIIDGQELSLAAGEGADNPDGPTLDLEPGAYTVTISVAGQPDQEEQIEVKADETWGFILGPGGAMPIQLY